MSTYVVIRLNHRHDLVWSDYVPTGKRQKSVKRVALDMRDFIHDTFASPGDHYEWGTVEADSPRDARLHEALKGPKFWLPLTCMCEPGSPCDHHYKTCRACGDRCSGNH